MADSIRNSTSSSTDGVDADFEPGLSFSRRVKIGVVLLLMLFGYFLMDERPQPTIVTTVPVANPTADTELQQLVDGLEFVEPQTTATTQQSTPPQARPQQAPLQLPAATAGHAPAPADASSRSLAQAATYQNPHTTAAPVAPPQPPLQSHQQRRSYHSYSSAPAVRTVLRFTGRIEPLQ